MKPVFSIVIWTFYLFSNLHFSAVGQQSPSLTDIQLETASKVSTCRAHCLDAFAHRFSSLTDSSCRMDTDCFMCWENCAMFQRSFDVWGSICADTIVCFEGCQLACSVYKNFQKIGSQQIVDPWSFPGPLLIRRNTGGGYMTIQWPQPVPVHSMEPPLPRAIYVLFWLSPSGWIQINQTLSTVYSTKNADIVLEPSPHVIVLAATRDGLVARLAYPPNKNSTTAIVIKGDVQDKTRNIVETQRTAVNPIIPIIAGFVTLALLLLGAVVGRRFLVNKQSRRFLLKRMNGVKIKRSQRPHRNCGKNNSTANDSTLTATTVATVETVTGSRNDLTNIASTSEDREQQNRIEATDNKSKSVIVDVVDLEKLVVVIPAASTTASGDDKIFNVTCEEFKRKLLEQKSIAV